MSAGRRWVPISGLIVVAVVGFIIASSGGSSKKKTETVKVGSSSVTKPVDTVTHVRIQGGKPVGGITTIQVNKGQPVRFDVTSDVADEIHVHGYNFHREVKKGGKVAFDFPAKIDGDFVIELEKRGEQIIDLKVNP